MIDAVKSWVHLSPAIETALSKVLLYQSGKRGDHLLKEGRICERIWFLEAGFARVYYFLEDKEVTDWIGGKDSFMLSIPSFFNQQPSYKSIELLSDCTYSSIHFQDLEKLYQQFHEMERFGRLISNYALALMTQKVEDLVFKSAQERYDKLMAEKPELFLNLPLGVIASYLGMTQETLSRMRSK